MRENETLYRKVSHEQKNPLQSTPKNLKILCGAACLSFHRAGSRLANRLGLYDMSGNVWEWVQDPYERSDSIRQFRGGSAYDASLLHCAYRSLTNVTDYRNRFVGLRLARVP
ncbi:hypothetical protein Mmc1_2002 [Magnetococcus marinus MC-1]|uniref:Sulfatase-modifying factor enzyme-like domain-containing protein n=1 Tax=Magnetococcus marinus (strain ATCC BAA-1437 / JCM 17883 / MC-1) TaxID=156889 RepID=A0L960_MAGMM|nr:SUMF1/EgtB/PvdO family nonheme iron enzyme [Magnetococcus marinus]ABK44503.1 hypothetical protein Mmc1_2002 [Magnetococcus marinus MC-1]